MNSILISNQIAQALTSVRKELANYADIIDPRALPAEAKVLYKTHDRLVEALSLIESASDCN